MVKIVKGQLKSSRSLIIAIFLGISLNANKTNSRYWN